MNQPLILTLRIDETAQEFYDDLRRRFFPPERNFIAAHLTLFHQLPDEEMTYRVLDQIAEASSRALLSEPSPRSIGRGVAVFFRSPPMNAVHATLSIAFRASLIAQDLQRLQPHIVVQNKVDPETARETLLELKACSLMEPHAIGLTLWRYLGGPWERLADFPFEEQVGWSV